MLDSKQTSESCQYLFCQSHPRFVCKNASRFRQISEVKGYVCKCRDPRCSLQCHANWAQKQSACLARHLHDLPEELVPYRGNLTLHSGATPEDHHRVRAAFLLALRRWAKKKGVVAELHATTHATSPINVHYDIVAYSESKEFRSVLREKWVSSGGLRATCVPLKEDELDATAEYKSKAVFRKSSNYKEGETDTSGTKKAPPKLLNSRQISGLDQHWHTRSSKHSEGFFRGSSIDEIWAVLCKEWHPEIDEDDLLARAMSRDKYGKPPKPVRQPDPAPLPAAYIPGIDLRRDAWVFAERMPTTPQSAVGATAYGQRWGVSGDWMLRCFKIMPHAVRLDGDIVNGMHTYNKWFIPDSVLGGETC
jgi:hypothetical protein